MGIGPLSVTEFELAGFFGSLPSPLDEDVPWQYNDSAYTVASGETIVSFSIAPAVRDVRILLTIASACVFDFHGCDLEDVRYHCEKGREALEVVVTSGNSIWLVLKPQISIRQVAAW